MSITRILIVSAAAGLAFHLWQGDPALGGDAADASENGFVAMPLPTGLAAEGIVIFAPEHCPSDAAQRADRLARHLSSEGIPYTRSQSARFSEVDAAAADRVAAVMEGEVPIVFVNGRAKANPRPQEVVSEYRSSKAS